MARNSIVPTDSGADAIKFGRESLDDLINQARAADEADQKLTLREAVKHYKKATFWAIVLSTSLIMEGYDLVTINSFYGQAQFQDSFGAPVPGSPGTKAITPSWQSGLSNCSVIGQLIGLCLNAWTQDRFGARKTMMFFMVWMALVIFIPVFSPSLAVLAVGEVMCGIPWGAFQTLSTTYASEVVPTVLRPYVTAYVCMCWGAGILLSSGVVRAVAGIPGELAWRLPFTLQWIWPVPLFIAAYFAPESPWNAIRRNKIDIARKSLMRLTPAADDNDRARAVEAKLAYIQYTTELEKAETAEASFIDCFRGTNARRTEINCVVWAAQILCGNAILAFSVVFLESAGFSATTAFDVNIGLSACYIIGGIICMIMFPYLGRATIYMGGLTVMFILLITIGGLGFSNGTEQKTAIAILFVISTLVNMISIGPVCYPIVAETPSGRLRYKTVVIGRFCYNLTGIVTNSITPRMVSPIGWNWGAKSALFYAGTNLLCNIWCWFRLPETKDRSFGEIDILFDNRVPARKFKTTSVAQFAIDSSGSKESLRDELKTDAEHVDIL